MNVKRIVEHQRDIFNILKRAKENDRLSHAYLFYGPLGTGKKEMAYALACLLYCQNDCCFECDECKNILDGNNLNVFYLTKEEKKTAITKEQIQELQEEFSKTSLVSGPRIYIVDGIDKTTSSAQNSLLKFIEEPENQEMSIGIFIAEELSNVLSTIQSRCELIYFKEIPKKIFAKNLEEEGLSDLDASLLSILSNNLDEAMNAYASSDYKQAKEMFLELLECKNKYDGVAFYAKYSNYSSTDGQNKTSKDYINNQKIIDILCTWLIAFLEDALFHLKNNDDLILEPLYDKIKAYKLSKKNMKHRLNGILTSYDKLRYNILPKNVFFDVLIYYLE